jgi:FtsZ-interacting cell division protein ZipA
MKADLRDVRTQLVIVFAVLLVLDVVAIAVLVSPLGRSRSTREQEFEQLRVEKIEKTRAAASAQGMEQKIETARQQEAAFNHDRLAERYSAMSERLSQIAKDAGVTVTDVKYDPMDEHAKANQNTPPGYEGIGITVQVHGTYTQNIRFINEVERQKMLLLIDGVSFGGMEKDALTVSVHLSTYLRSAA